MKAHRTDGVSLTFALIFLALAAWWLLAQLLHLALPAVGWIVALALILVGGLGLIGALRASRSAAKVTGPVEPDAATGPRADDGGDDPSGQERTVPAPPDDDQDGPDPWDQRR